MKLSEVVKAWEKSLIEKCVEPQTLVGRLHHFTIYVILREPGISRKWPYEMKMFTVCLVLFESFVLHVDYLCYSEQDKRSGGCIAQLAVYKIAENKSSD